jgi:tetrahydromethanopterin S-methyltransferase subunit G
MTLFARPAPKTPIAAGILLVLVLIPSTIVSETVSRDAGMAFGIAVGFVMATASVRRAIDAVGTAVLAAALAATSAAVDGPAGVALLLLASAVLLAVTNQHSAGLMALAPVVVILYGPDLIDLSWQAAFGWTLLGGLTGLAIARAMKFTSEPVPVDTGTAWRHAIVLGVLGAAALYLTLANEIPHGYWIAVTIVVALRPLPEHRADTLRGRLLGTLLGAVIALVVILVVPQGLQLLPALVFLYLLVTYALSQNYFMQTLFLTPMLLIFISIGEEEGITNTIERVFFTAIGIAVAVLGAILLDRWDTRAEQRQALAAASVQGSDPGQAPR